MSEITSEEPQSIDESRFEDLFYNYDDLTTTMCCTERFKTVVDFSFSDESIGFLIQTISLLPHHGQCLTVYLGKSIYALRIDSLKNLINSND
jgi:hypothetical protein